MKPKQISNYIPALTARRQLGQILRRVRRHNERFVVGRRGEAQVVIMSVQVYLRDFAADAPALKKVRRRAQTMGTSRLSAKAIQTEIRRYGRQRRVKNA
jgi:prevent-host-death family protein